MQTINKIRIGTRGSALALKQADIVKKKLCDLYPQIKVEIVTIITTGDKILDRNLADIGGKGLFIKEIEEHLLDNKIDIAVHSLKDMPAVTPDQFEIPCVLEREDVRDAFVSIQYKSFNELPHGAILGTSSSRRGAQVLKLRPDLKIIPLRGNINTRISKLKDGLADATFLAMAGLIRTGLLDNTTMHPIPTNQMLPAVSQGAIGIEILKENNAVRKFLEPINHLPTYVCTNTERSFMRVFEGSCATPIAALAEITNNTINLQCLIARPDGSIIHRSSHSGNISDAENIGTHAALTLKDLAGENFFD